MMVGANSMFSDYSRGLLAGLALLHCVIALPAPGDARLSDDDDASALLQFPGHEGAKEESRPRGLWPALGNVSHLMQSPSFLQTMSSAGFHLETMHLELYNLNEPWKDTRMKPLTSCRFEEASTVKDQNLREAIMKWCESDMGSLTEYFVDPRFRLAFDRLSDENGWIPEAFVTHVDISGGYEAGLRLAGEVSLLARSVHHFSNKPLVVANTGKIVPKEWDPERFPRMILLHARHMPEQYPSSYNKIRAMLFTKVMTGILVDNDQFINNGMDELFHRTKEEVTRRYPYPVLPVHWAARDPRSKTSDENAAKEVWNFKGNYPGIHDELPTRSMRWSHSRPTWTHHALPFVAKWSMWELQPEVAMAPSWLQVQGTLGEEEMFNVALWSVNATKQWCKFETTREVDYEMFLEQKVQTSFMSDSLWYPQGVPMVFYSAGGVANATTGTQLLEKLWTDSSEVRAPYIMHDGKWFSSGTELQKYDPGLKCMI